MVYKYNRILLIPIKNWDRGVMKGSLSSILDYRLHVSDAQKYKHFDDAKVYLTYSRKSEIKERNNIEYTEVFNNKENPQISFEDLLKDITDPEEIRVMKSIIKRSNGTR